MCRTDAPPPAVLQAYIARRDTRAPAAFRRKPQATCHVSSHSVTEIVPTSYYLDNMDQRTAQALVRFGLGRRGSQALPTDAVAWLAGQLDGSDPACVGPSSAGGLIAFREDNADRKAARQGDANAAPPTRVRDMFRDDAASVMNTVLTTSAPFRERLVWFWANHFTVSLRRGECTAVALPFIREAIRPSVNGRFVDMLFAVMRHPAMLIYLDNVGSIGPDSPAGLKNHRGLNENLARESLELHTVSPASGYTQRDVTEYAKVLTGWSFEINYNPPQFLFRLNAHEPGPKTVMGQTFDHGAAGGIQALTWLADHPLTHRHLASKLVRHFVADDPPPADVARIERVLRDTKGNLKAASLELIRLPSAWQPLAKLRTPMEYVVAVLRALDLPPDQRPDLNGVMGGMGQPFLTAPLPNGWPDTAADWAGGEALLRRVDWAYAVAGHANGDPERMATDSLGPLLQPATLAHMRRAGSRRDAITLLLASPEFQRR